MKHIQSDSEETTDQVRRHDIRPGLVKVGDSMGSSYKNWSLGCSSSKQINSVPETAQNRI